MKIKCSQSLIKLAKIFEPKASLFMVGGCVIDHILKNRGCEINITSRLTVEEVLCILENSEFVLKIRSAKFGKAFIICEDEVYSYSTFTCASSEEEQVGFAGSISEDCLSKDFTINAIYYNILSGDVVDPCGGLNDIRNKKIVYCSKESFNSNALNYLKAIKLAAKLNFNLDELVKNEIVLNAKKLKLVSGEGKAREFRNIVCLDSLEGIVSLSKLDLFKYIVLCKGYNLKMQEQAFSLLSLVKDSKYKMMAFYIDYYSFLNKQKPLSVKQFVTNVLRDGLKSSLYDQKLALQIISAVLSYDEENLAFYIANNICNIEYILSLFNEFDKCKSRKIEIALETLKQQKVPLSVKELKLSFREVKKMYPQLNEGKINGILKKILSECVLNASLNEKEKLINKVKKYI